MFLGLRSGLSYHNKRAKRNKSRVDYRKDSCYTCDRLPSKPCNIANRCLNVLSSRECDPNSCPAEDNCQNQFFSRGEQFLLNVEMTQSKGKGLFAKEIIPANTFIIEYIGEVIGSEEFFQKLSKTDGNFYFFTIGDKKYIDASILGNNARFINHSCEPNTEARKFTVNDQTRIGFFSLRTIYPVC